MTANRGALGVSKHRLSCYSHAADCELVCLTVLGRITQGRRGIKNLTGYLRLNCSM